MDRNILKENLDWNSLGDVNGWIKIMGPTIHIKALWTDINALEGLTRTNNQQKHKHLNQRDQEENT